MEVGPGRDVAEASGNIPRLQGSKEVSGANIFGGHLNG